MSLLTEGAGGWALPINNNEYLYDWVKAEQLPVILVVGMKLGCINHALLTAAHMQSMGVPRLIIRHCNDVVTNACEPAVAVRSKKDSSMFLCAQQSVRRVCGQI